jgi:hypothetical protein
MPLRISVAFIMLYPRFGACQPVIPKPAENPVFNPLAFHAGFGYGIRQPDYQVASA